MRIWWVVKSFTKLKCHIIHTIAFWSVSEPRAIKEINMNQFAAYVVWGNTHFICCGPKCKNISFKPKCIKVSVCSWIYQHQCKIGLKNNFFRAMFQCKVNPLDEYSSQKITKLSHWCRCLLGNCNYIMTKLPGSIIYLLHAKSLNNFCKNISSCEFWLNQASLTTQCS